jgi:hypothetical protein
MGDQHDSPNTTIKTEIGFGAKGASILIILCMEHIFYTDR